MLTQKTPKLSDDQNQSVAPPIKFVVPGKKTANSSKKKGQADEEPEEEEEAEEEIEVAEENEEEEEVEEEKDGGEEEDVEEEEESQQGTDDAITRTPPSTIKKGLDAERWSRNRKVCHHTLFLLSVSLSLSLFALSSIYYSEQT